MFTRGIFLMLVCIGLLGIVSAELTYNNPNKIMVYPPTTAIIISGNSTTSGNASFPNNNIAYLNNTQQWNGTNKFSGTTNFTGAIILGNFTCGKGEFVTQVAGSSGNKEADCQIPITTFNDTFVLILNRTLTQLIQGNINISANLTVTQLICNENGTCYNLNDLNATGSGGGGNPFDQILNRTSNVTFASVNTTKLGVGTNPNTTTVAATIRSPVSTANIGMSLSLENSTGSLRHQFYDNGKVCITDSGINCFIGANANLLQVDSNGFGGSVFATHTNTPASASQFQIRRSRGTATSPLAVAMGDRVGSFLFLSYDSTGYQTGAQFASDIDATNASATGSTPSNFWMTTGNSSATQERRFQLSSDGYANINASTYLRNKYTDRVTLHLESIMDTDTGEVPTNNIMEWGIWDLFSSGGGTPGFNLKGQIDQNANFKTNGTITSHNGTYYSGTKEGDTTSFLIAQSSAVLGVFTSVCSMNFSGGILTKDSTC